MLIVDNVTKFYGTYKVLDQISLRAQKGEVIGVIGSNGAGKSTFLNFLSGNLCPEQGCLVFNGADVYVDPLFYKSRVGFQTQRPAVMKDMRVFDFLKYVSQLKDIEGFQVMVQKILKDCQLSQVANYRIGELSEGYIQRVNLAQALLGNPEVLIFDEPTNGLDVPQVRMFREILQSLSRERTIFISTHILSELTGLCNRILFLKNGRIVLDSSVGNLFERNYINYNLRLEVLDPTCFDEKEILRLEGVHEVRCNENVVCVELNREKKIIAEVVRRVSYQKCGLIKVSFAEEDLERLFLRISSL